MKSMGPFDLQAIAEATYRKTAEIGLRHAQKNRRYVERTIADLSTKLKRKNNAGPNAALVISAGPSLHLKKTAERVRDSSFRGPLVATDGAFGYCLRNGLVPDYVVSVDPHPTRIVRWFGDDEFKNRPPDNYFRRQDLDPHWLKNERKRNHELLQLVNAVGPRVPAILSTSVCPSVTERVLKAGMPIYWWNPIYDDYDDNSSYTRRVFDLNGAPCMATGGNCGTAAWVFAGSVLRARSVGVTGMDLSYPSQTPIEHTQYFSELKKVYGDRFIEAYIHLKNPFLRETWFTDPTYWWYRNSFLSLAEKAPFKSYNCTEGGILFGKAIKWCTLEDFVRETSSSLKGRKK